MTKQSKHELIRLVETAAREVGRFDDRGVWLCVDELEASGRPIEHIRAWATVHFLPAGSPFDTDDADLWAHPIRAGMAEWLGRALGVSQPINFEWAGCLGRVVHDGVGFRGSSGHRV